MKKPLQPGDDPRKALPKHNERGKKRFFYTYTDIAALTNQPENTVRVAAHRKVFDPTDLRSVIHYVVSRGRPPAEPVYEYETPEEDNDGQ